MKICIISHPVNWTTGFGITCNKIATSLSANGHEVYCAGFSFGIISTDELMQSRYRFNIWNGNNEKTELEAVGNFINECDPDVIIVNFDIAAVIYFLNLLILNNIKKSIFAYTVLDGFPAAENHIDALAKIDGVMVPTQATRKYLRSVGLKNVQYAPHGVDGREFFSIPRAAVREKLKLNIKKDFVIGVFAKNDERKQIPKVLLALHHLVYQLKQKNIYLYLHTESQANVGTGWDLEAITGHLKLNNNVIFTEKDFRPQKGVEQLNKSPVAGKRALSYVERINMCDVIVNVPFSGGFELCTIEAQACGIPLITINDGGNIKEVAGDAAIFVEPKLKNIWKNGAFIYYVDEVELAMKILELRNNELLRAELRAKGFENIKRYRWRYLGRAVEKMILSAGEKAVLQNDYREL